ncbi:MAG TPA: LysR family transcriptional regulator [Xanthobacteraceae bacterium]|nr:LysR family transcriptional regulator [Xanthobacteraceae bacterium]
MNPIKLDRLQALEEVVRRGGFSAAAEHLRLTQPAVSLRVRELERRLGVRLVERVGRRIVATAAGSRLLAHAQRIDAAVADALEDMAAHAGGGAGRVRLGTGATACIYLLPPILRELRRRFPALEITVETGNSPDILKAVEENAIDIGLVTLPAAGRMIEVVPVIADELVLVAPKSMPLPARLTPAKVASLPLLLFEPGGNTRRIADGWFARARMAPQPVMALGSVEAIKELVWAGLGCAIVPRMAMASGAARRPLVCRTLSPPLHRRLGVVVRRDKPLHRGLREALGALTALKDGPTGIR